MANIRTKSDIRSEQKATVRHEHRFCGRNLFGRSYDRRIPDPVRGDVKQCEHGILLEYLEHDRFGYARTRAIKPHQHPFLYAKAKKLIAEEAMRQEERDSDGGS